MRDLGSEFALPLFERLQMKGTEIEVDRFYFGFEIKKGEGGRLVAVMMNLFVERDAKRIINTDKRVLFAFRVVAYSLGRVLTELASDSRRK